MTKRIDEQFRYLLYGFHLMKVDGCGGYFFKSSINIMVWSFSLSLSMKP
jgi:hypothetical protein